LAAAEIVGVGMTRRFATSKYLGPLDRWVIMSNVTVASASAATKRRFIKDVLASFADIFDDVESVFIKPNVVLDEPYPTTTDPQVLDTVLTYVSDYKVAVGDGPGYDNSWPGKAGDVSREHPLRSLCADHGVEWINLNQSLHVRRAAPYGLLIPLSVVPRSYNVIISLPVLKRHMTCTITGAVKNQFGLLDLSTRGAMHRGTLDIHRGIAAIAAVERCDLFILDAVETLLEAENVRDGGKRVFLGKMLAGRDPVALDCAGFDALKRRDPSLAQRKIQDIPHLTYAADCGAGSLEYKMQP
jgi:uncharacterized protein (DUF362 family)